MFILNAIKYIHQKWMGIRNINACI